jgi:eukaryotic-like serine/threonine-protein kinase
VPDWTDDGSIGHGGEQIGVYRLNANAPSAPMRAASWDLEQTLE